MRTEVFTRTAIISGLIAALLAERARAQPRAMAPFVTNQDWQFSNLDVTLSIEVTL